MKNAIIVHGKPSFEEYYDPKVPSCSNDHWYPWLQKQLIIHGISTQTPEMPLAFKPNYVNWKKEFENYIVSIDSILVGHSCGGGFLLRWLSEKSSLKIGTLVLVAPWLDPEKEMTTEFFNFTLDQNLISRTNRTIIFHSDNDHASIHKTMHILNNSLHDFEYYEFKKYGHFTKADMKTTQFPLLLSTILTKP